MNSNTFYKDYMKAKAHIAHKSINLVGKKRIHPSTVNFLLGCKNKHVIIDPTESFDQFVKSLYVIAFFLKKKKSVSYPSYPSSTSFLMIVNTNPEYINLIENFYQSTHPIYYCNEKWVGGLLTNWKQVSKSIKTFMEFSKRFEKWILRHNINFPRYKKMNQSFRGLGTYPFDGVTKQMERPDLIFLINPNENRHVVGEAVSLNIPVIAITDSNTNLSGISFPIPGNSNSIEFVHYCLQWVTRIVNK